jgi:hypothetical protein
MSVDDLVDLGLELVGLGWLGTRGSRFGQLTNGAVQTTKFFLECFEFDFIKISATFQDFSEHLT